MKNDYLQHHGVIGMKWGVRRYQNKDGSLTNAGRARAAKIRDRRISNANKSYERDVASVNKHSNKWNKVYGPNGSNEAIRGLQVARDHQIKKANDRYNKKVNGIKPANKRPPMTKARKKQLAKGALAIGAVMGLSIAAPLAANPGARRAVKMLVKNNFKVPVSAAKPRPQLYQYMNAATGEKVYLPGYAHMLQKMQKGKIPF